MWTAMQVGQLLERLSWRRLAAGAVSARPDVCPSRSRPEFGAPSIRAD